MMIIMQFTFQIILLGIGFGVGYWLLITANNQQGIMRTIGQALGGILIVMAMILAIFSCYYSMKISNRGYMEGGCPMNSTMNPMVKQSQNNENEEINSRSKLEQNTNTQMINPQENDEETPQKDENRPIKRNIKDHD